MLHTATRRRAAIALLLSGTLLGLAGTSAAAAPSGSSLPVREGRVALQALCPQAGEQIQAALGDAVWRHQLSTTLHASFVLSGTQISEVQVSGLPPGYALRLQRAVSALQCRSDSAEQPQRLRFEVATLTH